MSQSMPADGWRGGRQAGVALGNDAAGAVYVLAERVVARVQRAADTDLVSTPVGGMTLSDPDLVAALARRRGRDTELLLAATGRGALPTGYTVL